MSTAISETVLRDLYAIVKRHHLFDGSVDQWLKLFLAHHRRDLMAVCRRCVQHKTMHFNMIVYSPLGHTLYPPPEEMSLPVERTLVVFFKNGTFIESENEGDLTRGVCFQSEEERPLVVYYNSPFSEENAKYVVTYDHGNASGSADSDGSVFPKKMVTDNKSIIAWKIALQRDETGILFLAKPLAESYVTIRSEIEAIRDQSGGKYNLFRTGALEYSILFYLLNPIQQQGYQLEKITSKEMQWIKGATHGEKTFFLGQQPGKYEYDIRSAYASVCVDTPYKRSLHLPLKEGQYLTLSNEEFQSKYQSRELRYGIYRCRLEPGRSPASFLIPTFVGKKQSPYEYYPSDDLIVASTLGFQVTLATDGQPNFLYYTCIQREHVCEVAQRLFGHVLSDWVELRRKLPDNSIIKLMSSSFAGYLSSMKRMPSHWCLPEDVNPDERIINTKATPTDHHFMVQATAKERPFRTKMGRCLPFIYSRHRRLMFERVVRDHASKITYYHTDGFQTSEPLPEALTTPDPWAMGALRVVPFKLRQGPN